MKSLGTVMESSAPPLEEVQEALSTLNSQRPATLMRERNHHLAAASVGPAAASAGPAAASAGPAAAAAPPEGATEEATQPAEATPAEEVLRQSSAIVSVDL